MHYAYNTSNSSIIFYFVIHAKCIASTRCTQSLSSSPTSWCCAVRKVIWHNRCNNICCMRVTSPQVYRHIGFVHFGGGDTPLTGAFAINLVSSATGEKSLSHAVVVGGTGSTGTAVAVGITVGIRVALTTGIVWSSSFVVLLLSADYSASAYLRSCIISSNAAFVRWPCNQSTAPTRWLKPL